MVSIMVLVVLLALVRTPAPRLGLLMQTWLGRGGMGRQLAVSLISLLVVGVLVSASAATKDCF
jgi:hypothetical protein